MKNIVQYLFLFFFITNINAEVTLPPILSNHMIVKHGEPFHIYGYATVESEVNVAFGKNVVKAKVENGKWKATFPAQEIGGPYNIQIIGQNTIELSDIYFGEVFLCGGQSNMEWPVSASSNADQHLEDTNYPKIRFFTVDKKLAESPKDKCEGSGWKVCSKEEAADFSAIGFYLARQLGSKYNIPIGVIDNAWGGSEIDTWMSEDCFLDQPDYQIQIQNFKSIKSNLNAAEDKASNWIQGLDNNDVGKSSMWHTRSIFQDWETMPIPGNWEESIYPNFDGVVWMSYKINLKVMPKDTAIISLGKIDDSDETYINGIKIGGMLNSWNKDRVYTIPKGLLKKGDNHIVVRIIDTGGGGGMSGSPDDFYIKYEESILSLAGKWRSKKGTEKYPYPKDIIHHNDFPSSKYNAMVAPLELQKLSAILWYQGESDATTAHEYYWKFPRLIQDYRQKWGQSDLPFIYVQLANYKAIQTIPEHDDWAELRNAQTSALNLPRTAMVPTIDIGDADDIHPKDKLSVALRMINPIENMLFGRQQAYKVATPLRAKWYQDGVEITFQNTNALLPLSDKITGLAISKSDGTFEYADNVTVRDQNKLWIEGTFPRIGLIRYLWASNPGEITLFDQNALVIPPFQIAFD